MACRSGHSEPGAGKPLIHTAKLRQVQRRQPKPLSQGSHHSVGRSVVEAPFALLEVEVEVLPRDPVVAAQMAFGLVPEILDAVDVVATVGEPLPVINAPVPKLRDIKDIVGGEAVCVDDRVGLDGPAHDRHEGSTCGIGTDQRVDLAAPLQQAEDGYLAACAATALALASASEIALIHLDLTSEPLRGLCAKAGGNDLAQLVVEERRRMAVHADE